MASHGGIYLADDHGRIFGESTTLPGGWVIRMGGGSMVYHTLSQLWPFTVVYKLAYGDTFNISCTSIIMAPSLYDYMYIYIY